MSSQVTHMVSGDTIMVRTGTIQGIGPQGPVGPTGPQGDTGPSGPQGVPGPSGAVIEFSTQVNALTTSIGSSAALASYTLISFTQVVQDDLSAVASSTNYSIPVGEWQGNAYLAFSKQAGNAINSRSVQVLYNSSKIAGVTIAAAPTAPTEIVVPFTINVTTGGRILQVQASHDEGATLSYTGSLWISRIGPGPQGGQGSQGPAGVAGPVGATGPQGPAGTIATNTTTFSAIGG